MCGLAWPGLRVGGGCRGGGGGGGVCLVHLPAYPLPCQCRYGGKKHEKVVMYKRAKHEMFPKHVHAEGLTSRVTLYDDDE